MNVVSQIVPKKSSVNQLINGLEAIGVMGAGRLGRAVSIIEKMIKDQKCKVFLGLAGAMVPGGMRELIVEMVKKRWIDVLVSTGANITHDIIEALGHHHYRGSEFVDDTELRKKGIDRIFDSFMLNESYTSLEKFCKNLFKILPKEMSGKDFLWTIGKHLPNGILRTCYEQHVPVFCPSIQNCGLGLQIWAFNQENNLKINPFDDLKEMLNITWSPGEKGVIYIGGGEAKNYIQQALQFSPNEAKYAVQITMDRPEHGGSSGANLKEGISWGKLNENAEYVNLICDATIALPIIVFALEERL